MPWSFSTMHLLCRWLQLRSSASSMPCSTCNTKTAAAQEQVWRPWSASIYLVVFAMPRTCIWHANGVLFVPCQWQAFGVLDMWWVLFAYKDIITHNAQCTIQNTPCTMHNAQCTMHNTQSNCFLYEYPKTVSALGFSHVLWFGWAMLSVCLPYVWNGGLVNWGAKWWWCIRSFTLGWRFTTNAHYASWLAAMSTQLAWHGSCS